MKRHILIGKLFWIFIITTSILYGQAVDSVKIQMEDMRCQTDRWDEWECDIYAYLYKNGQPVEHQENYTYTWYWKEKDETQFHINSGVSGTGIQFSSRYEDGMYNQHFDNYITVEGPGFFVTSKVIDVGKDGSAQQVNLEAKSQNGSILSLNDYFREYTNPRWRSHWSDISIYFFLNEDRTLWTNTRIIEDKNEKYYQWDTESEPFINYHSFPINTYTNKISTVLSRFVWVTTFYLIRDLG